MWFEIVQVTPDGPEHVSGVHGLGGRLIRTIGSWNHRGVGGLAIKALCLLVIPHAELFYLHVPPRHKNRFGSETVFRWSSENCQAENNVSTKNNPRYKTVTVNSSRLYDLDPEPKHYIHLSAISNPIPAFVLCSDTAMNRAERTRMITTVLMAVSIFHSFWMQNVMLLRVSAPKLQSCLERRFQVKYLRLMSEKQKLITVVLITSSFE